MWSLLWLFSCMRVRIASLESEVRCSVYTYVIRTRVIISVSAIALRQLPSPHFNTVQVQRVLRSWTSDEARLDKMNGWLMVRVVCDRMSL